MLLLLLLSHIIFAVVVVGVDILIYKIKDYATKVLVWLQISLW